MSDRRLLAFYDLEVSPISFDFAVFVILAELHRQRSSASQLRIVIVPGRQDGFRVDDTAYDTDNKRWRLQNILLPLTALLDKEIAVDVCIDRESAAALENEHQGEVFPKNYSVADPIAEFFLSSVVAASARGESIPSFRAGSQSISYMTQWLSDHVGDRKPVVITLRESDYNENQNSNTSVWLNFAKELDPSTYCPVVVRDTAKCFSRQSEEFDGLLTCPLASINLQLRMALYELAWLNMLVPNGPGELCRLSDTARYLYFKVVSGTADTTSSLFIASQGIEFGGQLPNATALQRLVWEPDDPEIIAKEFSAIEQDIRAAGDPHCLPPSPENARDPIETAVQLQMTGRLEEAASIYQEIVRTNPENADAWHFLGIIAQQTGHIEAAERMVLRAVSLKDDQANYFVTIGHIAKSLDKLEDAKAAFTRAIAIDPDDAGAHADLADLLHKMGEMVQSETSMMRALNLAPRTVEYFERAAKQLRDKGDMTEAANFYARAVELREEASEIARKKADEFSEVPQITLGTN